MPAISQADAQAQLDAWMAANIAVSKNQSYQIGGRSFTKADSATILEQIKFWEAKVNSQDGGSRGGARVRYGVTG